MFSLNSGMLGDSSQVGDVAATALQGLRGAGEALSNAAIPRGGQNPLPQSGNVDSGRTARNSGSAGSSDSAADNNASANTPPVTDPKKLAGCDPCPEDDVAGGFYNFGLWREAQANELKYSQGRVRRSYETYSAGLDTSAGPIPLASGEDITGVVAIVVDHPDIFVFATSKLFHLKSPLLRYDDGVDTWYRWTLSESKDRLEVGEGGPGQTGTGLRSVAGQAFYDAVDKIITSIPGVPYRATGTGRVSTFKLSNGILQDGVSSSFTRHADQGLGGASMHRKHLVSFCSDQWTGEDGFLDLSPFTWANEGKILALIRIGDDWANDWEIAIQDLLEEDYSCLTFPSRYYNFSPPYSLGRFWHTLSAFKEARLWSLGDPSSPVPFESKLLDIGISLSGDVAGETIRSWFKPIDPQLLASVLDAQVADFYTQFTTGDTYLGEGEGRLTGSGLGGGDRGYNQSTAGSGPWIIWRSPVTGKNTVNPLLPPTDDYLDTGPWGATTGDVDAPLGHWDKVGTLTIINVWKGLDLTSRTIAPTDLSMDLPPGEELLIEPAECWNGKPIPLPAQPEGRGGLGIPASRLSVANQFSQDVSFFYPQDRNRWWHFEGGHDSCRVCLPDGRSWQAALYPEPICYKAYLHQGLYGNADQTEPVEYRLSDTWSGSVDLTYYRVGMVRTQCEVRFATYLIYSPTPGNYVEVLLSKSFSGGSYDPNFGSYTSLPIYTATEELPVAENVFQILPVPSLGLLLILRTDRDSIRTCYPIVEARSIDDPNQVIWTYEDLMSKSLLSADIGFPVRHESGENEWTLGTTQNNVSLRPVMKLVRETARHLLLVSTECFKKQLSTTSVPTRVEYRCLEITTLGAVEVENVTSNQTSSFFNTDARAMNYTPNVPIPRPRQLAAMAIADDVTYYNYETFLRMNDPGNIDDGVLPP